MFKSFSPEKTFKISMWIVSLLFAYFLLSLGKKVITDLPKVTTNISIEDFVNKNVYADAKLKLENAKSRLNELDIECKEAALELQENKNTYHSAKLTYNNWLATRSVTTSNPKSKNQDSELVKRTIDLEKLSNAERNALSRVEKIESNKLDAERVSIESNKIISAELEKAKPQYKNQKNLTALKVFALRLSVTLPLLIISGYLIAKLRKSSYWPLYRGFIIFSVIAFFFELVPYLPSYGGYIRSIVGIIVCLVGGHYGIKWMQNYLVIRQEQTQKNEQDRRSMLNIGMAIQKINSGLCPSCDQSIPHVEGVKVNHCVFCGLKLYDICSFEYNDGAKCNVRKNAFFKHCPSCGSKKEIINNFEDEK